ncbi:hypothetical protein BC834DRAFT_890109 [Gloeopeniophorella convolvens]|nr:hypothetical protein BC834DRAFT_890109 [Gloeopeniophorella convolvens]
MQPSTTSPSLLVLAPELLVHIIAFLPPKDICTCQAVCRRLNAVVDCSIYLRYLVFFATAGVHEPRSSGPTSISHRLSSLQTLEKSWQDLSIRKAPIKLSLRSSDFLDISIQDDTLVALREFVDCPPLEILPPGWDYVDLRKLPINGQIEPSWTSIHLDWWKDEYTSGRSKVVFSLALECDLTIAITYEERSDALRIRPMAFSTGARHPAANGVVFSVHAGMDVVRVSAEIVGDNLFAWIGSRDKRSALYLVSWKTGTHSKLVDDPRSVYGQTMTVLSENTFALSNKQKRVLEIFRIAPPAKGEFPLQVEVVSVLELPGLQHNIKLHSIFGFADHYPAPEERVAKPDPRPAPRLPFTHSPLDSLAIFRATFVDISSGRLGDLMLVTLRSALLAFTSPSGAPIPWDSWGPQSVRLEFGQEHANGSTISGQRWLRASSDKQLFLRDFNTRRTRQAHARVKPSVANGTSLSVNVEQSVVPRGKFFAHDLVSALPYVETSVALPPTWVNVENGVELDMDGEWLLGVAPVEHSDKTLTTNLYLYDMVA